MLLCNWNVTIGINWSLVEAMPRPSDDNKPVSTQKNIWTPFSKRLSRLWHSPLLALGIWNWLPAQHIVSSTPTRARFPGARLLCFYHLGPIEAWKPAGMSPDKCWPAARHSQTPVRTFGCLCEYVFVWFEYFPDCPFLYCLVTLRCSFLKLCWSFFFFSHRWHFPSVDSRESLRELDRLL